MKQDIKLTIDCDRFSPFTFQLAFDEAEILPRVWRAEDFWKLISTLPILKLEATTLEKEVIASGVYSTHTIEGGTLTEEETQEILKEKNHNQDSQKIAVLNIKNAYLYAKDATQKDWKITPEYIKKIHTLITTDLPDKYNIPGQYRQNPKNIITQVGKPSYKPPQYYQDIIRLIEGLCQWTWQLEEKNISPFIIAPLVHFYYEMIHPFWDGNGRVGRVLEASILLSHQIEYVPFAQARYYLDHLEDYFSLFDQTRRAGKNKKPDANTAFIKFFLRGIMKTNHKLFDYLNKKIQSIIFLTKLQGAMTDKTINERIYTILEFISENAGEYTYKTLTQLSWYKAQYKNVTDRTERRDWVKISEWTKKNENDFLYPNLDF